MNKKSLTIFLLPICCQQLFEQISKVSVIKVIVTYYKLALPYKARINIATNPDLTNY